MFYQAGGKGRRGGARGDAWLYASQIGGEISIKQKHIENTILF
jgi:hypothetical protein